MLLIAEGIAEWAPGKCFISSGADGGHKTLEELERRIHNGCNCTSEHNALHPTPKFTPVIFPWQESIAQCPLPLNGQFC